jgi:hypothetical protein
MLRISPPGRLDEGDRFSLPGVRPIPLEHKIEFVGIAVEINPDDFFPERIWRRPLRSRNSPCLLATACRMGSMAASRAAPMIWPN